MNERNKRLHEELMGLCWHEWHAPAEPFHPGVKTCRKCDYYPNVTILPSNPDYLHDLASAFRIVEKLREEGWRIELNTDPHTKAWFVILDCGDYPLPTESADTLPAAICEAAIKILDSRKEQV